MQVKLDEPGVGLPKLELFLLKCVFRGVTRFKGREYFKKLFESEADRITQLVENLEMGQGEMETLVKRMMGIEDSSRNWSVYMTLQHLNIVNQGLCEVVRKLSAESAESDEIKGLPEVNIADVKPNPASNESDFMNFVRLNRVVMKKISKIGELRSNDQHEHPWFGMLDGFQWFALMGIHMSVHRKQIESIISNLSDKK